MWFTNQKFFKNEKFYFYFDYIHHLGLLLLQVYLYECPWPSAQAEIATISAYKTPLDKLQCVFRCATTIVNLLSMACDRGPPAADDLVPVMVYVLIKVSIVHK